MNVANPHDMSRPSWKLYNRLMLLGVSVEEASDLMNGYAHELAETIRNNYGEPRWPNEEPEYAYGYNAATHDAADLIDPQASKEPTA